MCFSKRHNCQAVGFSKIQGCILFPVSLQFLHSNLWESMGIHFVKSRDSPTSPDLAERSHVHGFLSVKVAHLSLKFRVSSRSDLILVADRSAKEAKSIGGFPKIGGVPLVIHLNRIFHCETSTYWGTPSMEIPICFFSSFSLGHRYQLQGCIITSSVPVLSSIMANLSAAIHTCMYIHKYIYIYICIYYT